MMYYIIIIIHLCALLVDTTARIDQLWISCTRACNNIFITIIYDEVVQYTRSRSSCSIAMTHADHYDDLSATSTICQRIDPRIYHHSLYMLLTVDLRGLINTYVLRL